MQTISTVTNIKKLLKIANTQGKTIALVPTMGGIHKGHLSLVEMAKKYADIVVVSIFVNPTQFGKDEDFSKYPRTLEMDKKLLKEHQVDILFTPSTYEIYPQSVDDFLFNDELGLSKILCGVSRPEHFKGVVQVVKRLFDIVKPDVAVFGQKDYQQLLIIKKNIKDVKIISAPIVREAGGLALSTRNKYLSASKREIASNFYKILSQLKSENLSKNKAKDELKKYFKLEYLEILDANTLKQINDTTTDIAILSAVFLEKTRLIDNIIFRR